MKSLDVKMSGVLDNILKIYLRKIIENIIWVDFS